MLNVPTPWRIRPSWNELSPWGAGEHGRSLRVVLDEATTTRRPALSLLQSFVGHRGVEIYSTRPDATWRVEIGDRPNEYNALDVRYLQPSGERDTGLWDGEGIKEYATRLETEVGLSRQLGLRLLRLRQAGIHHQLDAIVTDVEFPRLRGKERPGLPLDTTSPERAAWVLGLYLRAHQDYTVAIEGNHSTFLPSERFYRAAAMAAVRSDGWLTVARHAYADGQLRPLQLLDGMISRLARMLRMRDLYAVRIRHWRPDDTWDESLCLFEAALVFLSAALDAAARYLHEYFEVPAGGRQPNFRSEDWIGSVLSVLPRLDVSLEEKSPLRSAASAVAAVRNLIHERAPSESLESYINGRPMIIDHRPGVIALGGRDARRLSGALEHLGDPEDWGVRPAHPEGVTILPFVLMPKLIRTLLDSLAVVIEATADDDASAEQATRLAPDLRYRPTVLLLAGLSADQPPVI